MFFIILFHHLYLYLILFPFPPFLFHTSSNFLLSILNYLLLLSLCIPHFHSLYLIHQPILDFPFIPDLLYLLLQPIPFLLLLLLLIQHLLFSFEQSLLHPDIDLLHLLPQPFVPFFPFTIYLHILDRSLFLLILLLLYFFFLLFPPFFIHYLLSFLLFHLFPVLILL